LCRAAGGGCRLGGRRLGLGTGTALQCRRARTYGNSRTWLTGHRGMGRGRARVAATGGPAPNHRPETGEEIRARGSQRYGCWNAETSANVGGLVGCTPGEYWGEAQTGSGPRWPRSAGNPRGHGGLPGGPVATRWAPVRHVALRGTNGQDPSARPGPGCCQESSHRTLPPPRPAGQLTEPCSGVQPAREECTARTMGPDSARPLALGSVSAGITVAARHGDPPKPTRWER